MNPALLDSDVVIDVLRDDEAAIRCLARAIAAGDLYASVITRTEVFAGMRPGEEDDTAVFLASVQWLGVDEEVADRAGELSRLHRRRHPGIDVTDYLIAATAEVAGLRLLTRNVKHYPMFKRLRPAY